MEYLHYIQLYTAYIAFRSHGMPDLLDNELNLVKLLVSTGFFEQKSFCFPDIFCSPASLFEINYYGTIKTLEKGRFIIAKQKHKRKP